MARENEELLFEIKMISGMGVYTACRCKNQNCTDTYTLVVLATDNGSNWDSETKKKL